MSLSATRYEHISLNRDQTPVINGSSMKVIELVQAKHAHGWSPEELHFQFPSLSLGQIYSALAYYWDHREILDADIANRLRLIDTIKDEMPPSPLKERLKAEGLI